MAILMQVICTIILGISLMNVTLNTVWPSSTILIFKSENTTLHRPMNSVEISLLTSLPACGSFIAVPLLVGIAMDRLGRKPTVIVAATILVVSWAIKAATNRVEAMLFAATLSGFGNTLYPLVVVYISEFVQDSIRGTMSSSVTQFSCFGLLLSYILGGVLEYHVMVYTHLSLAVFSLLMITVLKESPISLMAKGREKEAAESLAFYNQLKVTSKEVEAELKSIRRSLTSDAHEDHSIALMEGNGKQTSEPIKMSTWQLFKSTPSIRRQFYLVLVLNTATILQGQLAMLVYAGPMFTAALGDSLSPFLCTIILALSMYLTGVLSSYLCDKSGRRPLIIYASIVAGICSTVIATQLVTDWFPKVTIPIIICVFGATLSLGIGTVSYVIASEIFLPEVKGTMLMLSQEWSLICQFSSYFLFNIIVESVRLSTVFFFFSFVDFISSIFFIYRLPETKGLSIHAIQEIFSDKKQ